MPSEFQFLSELRQRFNKPARRILTGIGDDAAVISQRGSKDMVVTADMLVEDIDFCLDWITPRTLGHKTLAISLSDIAAMGAKPVWSIVSLGIPKVIWESNFAHEFYEGWAALADKYGVTLVGGDISKTPDKLVIDSIVGGEVRKNRALKRSEAKPGDLVYVTGELGGAAAGLKILQDSLEQTGVAKKLIRRQLEPEPRCEIGRILGEFKIASAMIDISDGLSSDLAHICNESKVGAIIHQDRIPIDENLRTMSFTDEFDLAIDGGEDFELLFTAPKRLRKDLRNKLEKLPATCIGEITANAGIIELHGANGVRNLSAEGFRHF